MASSPTAALVQNVPSRLQEYQANTIFVGFMGLVCTSAIVYLTQNLSEVIVPLMWAAFAAMPLTGLISVLNPTLIRVIRCCSFGSYRPLPKTAESKRSQRRPWYLNRDVRFTARSGEAFIRLPKADGEILLEEVNEPDWVVCPRFFYIRACCRRRVKVKGLSPSRHGELAIPHRHVNRLVNFWEYYIRPIDRPIEVEASDGEDEIVCVELFLDAADHYPALMEPLDEMPDMVGLLEVDSTHSVSYAVATVVALCFVMLCLGIFIWLVSAGAMSLHNNVNIYLLGGREFIEWIGSYAQEVLPADMSKDLDHKAVDFLNERLPEIATGLLNMIEGLGFEILIFLLYLLFWILEPLPISREVSALFRTYLLQKSLVCLIFATLTSGLLLFLKCPLWAIFFLVAFFLNYIPEVGPIVCYVIMLPLIVLDGNLTMHERLVNTIVFSTMFLVFKFVTGNIIEVQLYAKSGGDLMRMHPVIMLALMMLFQTLMGMTGMFMTVPVMAAAKYYMLSMNVPSAVLDPLLTCLEGSEQGPHMNFVEQERARAKLQAAEIHTSSEEDDSDENDSTIC